MKPQYKLCGSRQGLKGGVRRIGVSSGTEGVAFCSVNALCAPGERQIDRGTGARVRR